MVAQRCPFPSHRAIVRACAVAGSLATVAAACGPAQHGPPVLTTSLPPEILDAGADADASDADAAAPPKRPPRTVGHEIDGFYADLRALTDHTRRDHVRIAWLGDSHGAGDMWTGALRTDLQTRFGDGGLGFVHIGSKSYRHDGVRADVRGHWGHKPKVPPASKPTGDGIFGLGGITFVPSAQGPKASVTLIQIEEATLLHWDLCLRFRTPADTIKVNVTGAAERVLKPETPAAVGGLQHITFETNDAHPSLTLGFVTGQAEVCGVVIETDGPTHAGVVVDTLGINGARLTTPLAWNERAWIDELARRKPSLVIFEYGTNEASDNGIAASVVQANLGRMLTRVRAASPDVDCVVLSPTDRGDKVDVIPKIRDAFAAAARSSLCQFWDTHTVMGGRGAILQWRNENPPRAAADGVHLTPRGYHDLGERLAKDLLAKFAP